MNIAQVLNHYLDDARREGRRSLASARSCVRALTTALGDHAAETLTYTALRDLAQQWLAAGNRPATANRRLGVLRRALRVAQRDGLIPAVSLDTPHFAENNVRQGFVTEDVMQRILHALADHPHVRDLVEWLWLTAMRRGEAAKLTWDMYRDEVLYIPGTITKNGQPRVFPVPPGSPLEALLHTRRAVQRGSFIFHDGRGRPLLYIQRVWKRAAAAAGVPEIVPHDLRRSAVRRFRQRGTSIEVCMALAGHTTPSMFYRYRIIGRDEMADALRS